MATRMKRTRSSGPESNDADYPLNIDPSLMTERQQLAFLLRTTAQKTDSDSSERGSSSSASDTSDDEGEAPWRAPKKPRRAPVSRAPAPPKTSPKSPPAASREEIIAAALKNPNGVVVYCGRGRPPKNAIKLAPGEELPDALRKLVKSPVQAASDPSDNPDSSLTKNELRVKTRSEEPAHKAEVDTIKTEKAKEKTSPSSTNDHDHIQVFEDHTGAWSTQCALCWQPDSPFDARFDALFLCPTCDRKYPTQRALGLV